MRLFLAILGLCAACDRMRGWTGADAAVDSTTRGVDVGPWMLEPSATSMTLAWTSDAAYAGQVVFGIEGTDQTASESARGTEHRVALEGLNPSTTYRFRIEGTPPAEGTFTTAPTPGEAGDLQIVVYGDNRTNGGDHALVARAVGAERAHFSLHTGDMVVNAKDVRAWKHWFAEERDVLAHLPIVPTVGNHELTDHGVAYSRWFQKKGRPTYHSFDAGSVHVVVLDSFEIVAGATPQSGAVSDAQRQWLEADLKSVPPDTHVLVLVHQGPFAHPLKPRGGNHGGSEIVRRALASAVRIHAIDAVFAGHEHFYERGEIEGLRYFVVGGGGAPLDDPDPTVPGVQASKKALSYVVLDVRGCKIAGTVKDIAGNVIDTFALGSCAPPVAQAPEGAAK